MDCSRWQLRPALKSRKVRLVAIAWGGVAPRWVPRSCLGTALAGAVSGQRGSVDKLRGGGITGTLDCSPHSNKGLERHLSGGSAPTRV